jgi:hypothetical protein
MKTDVDKMSEYSVGIRIDTTEIKMKSKGDSEAGTGVKLPKP